VFLLLELCLYGNLRHQLAKGGIHEATAARNFRHLFQGLRDIHAAGVMHRDIKLDNLLITTNGILKISDFGWAAEFRRSPCGLAGTYETMAPEVLQGQPQTPAVDIWSAGAVLFHVICGRPLLPNATPETALDQIASSCPLRYRPPNVSEECWDLLRRLLEIDATRRPTAAQVLEHPWLCTETPAPLQQEAGRPRSKTADSYFLRAAGA
jgi:p21-activated kinase 1